MQQALTPSGLRNWKKCHLEGSCIGGVSIRSAQTWNRTAVAPYDSAQQLSTYLCTCWEDRYLVGREVAVAHLAAQQMAVGPEAPVHAPPRAQLAVQPRYVLVEAPQGVPERINLIVV